MEYTTIIIGIVLLFFIILFVLLITYSILLNKSKENARGMGKKMPPIDYMIMEGVKCPDYWVYMGDDKNGVKHRPTFYIDTLVMHSVDIYQRVSM